MKAILTPIDFSGVSDAVLETAAELARAIQAKVVILHVIQPPVITSEYGPVIENISEVIAASEKGAARSLAKIEDRLGADGLQVEVTQLTGAPALLIAEEAAKIGAAYIVMGSHGHTAFYDLIVGSTTHLVLKKATCPVVIVPPPKKPAAKKTKK